MEEAFPLAVRSAEKPFEAVTGFASPSITLRQQPPYDIFMSHRGLDAKCQLVSPIYYLLGLLGVKAFFEREELNLGDPIPQALADAISNAHFHIAIFSKNYARSPWCLEELFYMLETGAPIIPIFYDVNPGDVRRVPLGIYDQAFREYEAKGRYASRTLEKWKLALHKASFYSGLELKSNGDLGDFFRKLEKRVLQEMTKVQVPFEVDTDAVGLDDLVQDFECTTRRAGDHQSVNIVGICGIGGCGKTTLAQELYNRKYSAYDSCSFLSGVREKEVPILQRQLLRDLLHFRDVQLADANEGRRILFSRLRAVKPRRMLIVLDDVDHVNQLSYLLPDNGRSLESGSLIIVITRDSGILRKWDITSVYQMPSLNPHHAKQLFCQLAFSKPSPPVDFEELVQGFVDASNGWPLYLKIIAGTLRGKNAEKWKIELRKISMVLPGGIEETLRCSYGALDEHEKNIFLDVACFFHGEKENLALAVWDAAHWSSLDTLVEKSLVKVDKQRRIMMHTHLRDLGREIAAGCPLRRLWSRDQISKIMTNPQPIRGIIADTNQFDTCCGPYPPCFEELKVLVVAGNHFTSGFDGLSINPVWLRWTDFQLSELPSWVSLEHLRALEIYGADKLLPWENSAHHPEELTQLTIGARQGSEFDKFPSEIAHLKRLTMLTLTSHGEELRFTKLPEGFCGLKSLEHVELPNCRLLSSLPDQIGDLRNLRYLDLRSCKDLMELPNSIKQLTNLEYLDISDCKKLSPMPDVFEKMKNIEILYISGCQKWKQLPLQTIEQKSLRELHQKNTNLTSLPNNIGQLCKLEMLVIGSSHLKSFPESLGDLFSLIRLKIVRCIQLESLPESVERLKHLEHLTIKGCENMRSLPEGLRRLSNLQSLRIINCPIGELDFGSGSSSSLGKLKIIHIQGTDVTRLKISQDCCPSLDTLQLLQNYSLVKVDDFPKSVKTVKVHDCIMLQNINREPDCRVLQNINRIPGLSFDIARCPKLEQYAYIRKQKSVLVNFQTEYTKRQRIFFPEKPTNSGNTLFV